MTIEPFALNDKEMFLFFDNLANGTADTPLKQDIMGQERNNLVFDIAAGIDLAKFYRNLCMMYSEQDAKEQVLLVDNLQKIFRTGFRIDGLERLLAVNYTDIEWSMFVEYDFNNHESKYYRDHFFHQFRDAYMAFQLIEKCEVLGDLEAWLKSCDRVIAKYIRSMCGKHILLHAGRDIHSLSVEIMIKAILLSAVFHDLGYPLSYYMRVTGQIQQTLPYYSAICCAEKTNFQQIKAILGDTLLFRTVPADNIKKKYEKNDHGLMSAICFLLNFYSSGAIFDLSPADRCIVELSARSIYDHTNVYEYGSRITFDENPISFLLRICDDLQEWARFGLSVDENSNAMLHPKTFQTISKSESFSTQYGTQTEPLYFYKATNTKYKKINFVSACDDMEVCKENGLLKIKLNYIYYSLLEISSMNFSYAIYRKTELDKLGNMLRHQKYFPDVELSYELSNNIFYLADKLQKQFSKEMSLEKIKKVLLKLSDDDPMKLLLQNYKDGASKTVLKNMKLELKGYLKQYKGRLLTESTIKDELKTNGKVLSTSMYSQYIAHSNAFLQTYIGILGFMSNSIAECANLSI